VSVSVWIKDPDAVLDYAVDWSAWLTSAETIVSALVLADDGITVDSDSYDGGIHTIWLSGGEVGRNYRITSRITTSQGRVDDRTMLIRVRER
jgi:hypothetical protein